MHYITLQRKRRTESNASNEKSLPSEMLESKWTGTSLDAGNEREMVTEPPTGKLKESHRLHGCTCRRSYRPRGNLRLSISGTDEAEASRNWRQINGIADEEEGERTVEHSLHDLYVFRVLYCAIWITCRMWRSLYISCVGHTVYLVHKACLRHQYVRSFLMYAHDKFLWLLLNVFWKMFWTCLNMDLAFQDSRIT